MFSLQSKRLKSNSICAYFYATLKSFGNLLGYMAKKTFPEPENAFPELSGGEKGRELVEHANIEGIRNKVGTLARAAHTLDTSKELTDAERELIRRHILEDLEKAGDAEAKMHRLAVLLDVYPIDAVMGAVPLAGDLVTSALAVLYTFGQIFRVKGLGSDIMSKTLGYHFFDLVVGSIADLGTPLVSIPIDYLVTPNTWVAEEFSEHLEHLIEEARAQGISEEDINAAIATSSELKSYWILKAEPIRRRIAEIKARIFEKLIETNQDLKK